MSIMVAVMGANGVYARHLIPRLLAEGYRVRAIVRRPEVATLARAAGAKIAVADMFDQPALTAALSGCSVAINLATSLPGPSGRGDYAANDRLRAEGTAYWIAACRAAGVERLVQQSIGMVNSSGSDEWSDEDAPYGVFDESLSSRAIAASLAMEELTECSDLDWLILRGGLFYGPGTGFDESWHAMAAAEKLRLPGDGNDFVSLVHIADMAAATILALKNWPSKQKLIVCDNEPARWHDVFGFVCAIAGQAAPPAGGRLGFPSFRLRNARFRELTGWAPLYASYREGLVR